MKITKTQPHTVTTLLCLLVFWSIFCCEVASAAAVSASTSNFPRSGSDCTVMHDAPTPLGSSLVAGCSSTGPGSNATIDAFANVSGLLNVGGLVTVTNPLFSAASPIALASGSAEFDDRVTFNSPLGVGAEGVLKITGHPTGAVVITCAIGEGAVASFCASAGGARGEVTINGQTVPLFGLGADNILLSVTGTDRIKTTTVFPELSGGASIPITFGTEFLLSYTLGARIGFGNVGPGGVGTISASISDPPLFELFDAQMNPLQGATITSAAGVNYAASSSVPEPNTWTLSTAGMLALIFLARYRRNQGIGTR